MNYTDLSAVNALAIQKRAISATLTVAAQAQILVAGKPIDPTLYQQLQTVGIPVVQSYYASARAAIVTQLSALGVTV